MITIKQIEDLDQLVEDVDYTGGVEQDVALADRVCQMWPEIEPVLRAHVAGVWP